MLANWFGGGKRTVDPVDKFQKLLDKAEQVSSTVLELLDYIDEMEQMITKQPNILTTISTTNKTRYESFKHVKIAKSKLLPKKFVSTFIPKKKKKP